MKNNRLISVLLSAMFISIGLILPFFTGQIQQIGNMLLPMHLPVMLCGLICGWQYGLIVGFILPCFRSLLFGMPAIYPSAIAMSFELATYGLVVGCFFQKSKWKCLLTLYKSLFFGMLAGRVVWGITMTGLLAFKSSRFTLSAFFAGAFVNAIPGIILQLVLIPAIMLMLKKTHFVKFKNGENKNAKPGK